MYEGGYCFADSVAAALRYAGDQELDNEQADLQHPGIDDSSPDWPPDSEVIRDIKNNCRVAPAELPGVLTVPATGPIGYPGYDLWIADYSSVGMSAVNVTAPGGEYFQATGTVQDAILAALTSKSDPVDGIWDFFDFLEITVPSVAGGHRLLRPRAG